MSKPKFAAIHSGLLARKGEATPAVPHPLIDPSFTDGSAMEQPVFRRFGERKPAAPSPVPHLQAAAVPAPRPETPRPSDEGGENTGEKSAPAEAPSSKIITPSWRRPSIVTRSSLPSCDPVCPPEADAVDPAAGHLDTDKIYKVSLRINGRQRQLLRLAGAVLDRSQQELMAAAVDTYIRKLRLRDMKGCGCFGKRADAYTSSLKESGKAPEKS